MDNKKKNCFLKYMKAMAVVLLSSVLFYFGMKDYVHVGKTDIGVAELYGNYPTVSQAKQLWQDSQKGDEITDLCFLWNGGVQTVKNSRYFRQTNARVTGVIGMAALYDRQAALMEESDENGCVIDKNTALDLFGSENCVGNQLVVGEDIYEVRGVAFWSQHMLLIRPSQKKLFCTQVLIRSKKGQSVESTASNFLLGNGLSGTLVDDSWMDVILPLFPVAFFVMFTTSISRWMYRSENGDKQSGSREEERNGIDHKKFSCFIMRILLWGICLFFCTRLLSDIPKSWLPDKWSDFSFWPAKIQKTVEAFRWYIMFPKTMAQAERLVRGISCMIKCGAAALLIGIA